MFRIQTRMHSLPLTRLSLSQKTGAITLAALLVFVLVVVAFGAPHWPFSERSITRDLEQATSSAVSIGTFRTTWFPHPGCIANNLILRDAKTSEQIGAIRRLQIVGSYSGLIGKRKHLLSFEADGAVVNASQKELPFHPSGESKKQIELDRFVLHDATLQVHGDSDERLTFTVPELEIRGLGATKAGSFSATVNVPRPQMTVQATGNYGPLVHGNISETPVSGEFKASRGSLATFDALRGKLSGSGKFSGTFTTVNLDGNASSPDFELSTVEHPLPLSADFRARVTIMNGEINFQSIDAELGKTPIHGTGVISPIANDAPGFLNLDLDATSGTVNDLLWLFSKAPEPNMIGPIRFHTTAALAKKPRHFLQEIVLKGDFVINNARFSSPTTQAKLGKLSKRAEGHPDAPPTYTPISLLSGDVDLHEAVAYLTNVQFRVEGADANGGGTFNVEDKKINLNGKLRMTAELSDTTKGFKSKLLKLLDPFHHKKNGKGSDVPVSITGTSSHPKFAVHIMKK